jgi:dienelactone hydrolase
MLNIRSIHTLLLLVIFSICAGCNNRATLENVDPVSVESTSFETADKKIYPSAIHRPAVKVQNGWAVLMIGGGFSNDLDWTVPGFLEIDGKQQQITINGNKHTDGPVIASALVDQGFIVMRYGTISFDDPKRDQWPNEATPRSLAELTQDARSALLYLRRQKGVDANKIILLGHSLGAARACTLAAEDAGIKAVILLAPAYFANDSDQLASTGLIGGRQLLETRKLSCLTIFGEADDSKAVDYAKARELANEHSFDIYNLPDLAHTLGRSKNDLVGPIDQSALSVLSQWAAHFAAQN